MAACAVNSERGEGTEGNQDAPDDVVRKVCGEQRGGEQRADDETRGLHGEDERDEHAAIGLAGILAHDGGGDWVVAADADAEDEAEADEPPDVGREGACDGTGGEHQDFDPVDALAAEHIGDAAEEQRADRGGEQGGRIDERFLELAGVPDGLEQGHHDADDEEVVGVGEKAHAGDEHDLPVLFRDAGVVHFREVGWVVFAGVDCGRHGERPS